MNEKELKLAIDNAISFAIHKRFKDVTMADQLYVLELVQEEWNRYERHSSEIETLKAEIAKLKHDLGVIYNALQGG